MRARFISAIKGVIVGLLVGFVGVTAFGAIGRLLLGWLFPLWDMKETISFAVYAGIAFAAIGGLIGWVSSSAMNLKGILMAVSIIYIFIPTLLWLGFGSLLVAHSVWEGSSVVIETIQAGKTNWGSFVGQGILIGLLAPPLIGLVFGVPLFLSTALNCLIGYLSSNESESDDESEAEIEEKAERQEEE